jgi:hypothetical protein
MKTAYFATQTDIGKLFGISNRKVGKVLTEWNYRLPTGEPSSLAWSEGIVETKRLDDRPFVTFWIWDVDRVSEILEAAGYERVSP